MRLYRDRRRGGAVRERAAPLRVKDHVTRYMKVLAALSIGLMGPLLESAKPSSAQEKNMVTAIDILLEPDATMLRRARANNASHSFTLCMI